MPDRLPHLRLRPPAPEPFRYPGTPRDERPLPTRDPQAHARKLLNDIEGVENALREIRDLARPETAQGHLVKAQVTPDTPANISGLGSKPTQTKVVARTEDGAIIHLKQDDLGPLRHKISDYANPAKKRKNGARWNTPLVAPLEQLSLASLEDLSEGWISEDDLDDGQSYWVELWTVGGRLSSSSDRQRTHDEIEWLLTTYGAPSVQPLRSYVATEHDIYLVALPGAALRVLPKVVPEVYRVGPPLEAQVPWLLAEQASFPLPDVSPPNDPATVVTLLDTGVADQHPLLQPAVYASGQSVVVGNPDPSDQQGHGTRMAGLAAFANLGASLATGSPITPRTHIQSVKVMEGATSQDDLAFWPERTEDAITTAEQDPAERRVFSLSIGAKTEAPGDRTTWGMAVDSLAHGQGDARLICVAAGNLIPSSVTPPGYPASNLSAGMTTPAEAINAVSVGAHTDFAISSLETRVPVAKSGELSPFSRCDVGGSRPIKPDIVLEGGNWTSDGSGSWAERAMSLVTTDRGHAIGPPLTVANATSAACASASGMLAEIWQANPNRRPETIRGLLVHSARWTPAMRSQFPDNRDLRRAFGYGTPMTDVASFSETRRPTLVLESKIYPERPLGKGRPMHFVELPLPDQVLAQLGERTIDLAVTLSYFTEPNESSVARYQGVGLRWDIQRPLESEAQFRARVNKLERTDSYQGASDDLDWDIGPRARQRGTVQSDRCKVSAQELLGSRAVAIWTVGGWWRDRDDRKRASVPYSLIITLDAGDAEVDLYTAIQTEITIAV